MACSDVCLFDDAFMVDSSETAVDDLVEGVVVDPGVRAAVTDFLESASIEMGAID
jgi:hypothetical protein